MLGNNQLSFLSEVVIPSVTGHSRQSKPRNLLSLYLFPDP